jgi:uncharacterized protein YjdB
MHRGMNSSLEMHMRKQRAFLLALALGALIGCDSGNVGTVAGLGGTGGTGNTGNTALTLLPTDVQITVGSTTQLSTNAGTSSSLQWTSSNTSVATVSSTGLVTGFSVGTATITVRFAADTTNVATSNISVTQ